MNISLAHLPEEKQQELALITAAIKDIAKPQMLILFGSYARGNWVFDIRKDEMGTTTSYISDYDVLVVMENRKKKLSRIEEELTRKINQYTDHEIPLSPIVHDIETLNKELEEGNYFFTEIVRDGIMLYDSGQYQLSEPTVLSPADRANKAKMYFEKWMQNADDYLLDFKYPFERGGYGKAAFELHQAAERYFAAISLVFTDNKARTHDLHKLNKDISVLDERFKTVFPLNTPEEKERFKNFNKAYIDSRYKLYYTISKEDLEYLVERVNLLQQLAGDICREQIEKYRGRI